ncbi:hypothetical protein CCHL11_02516 [Colletotrichum chlorophyti]|uniref:Celp0028 effector like protein n=1 Tax=Colletotrichum chlorophyti TaxID=708187 RepID=A0A1Q8S8Q2_9PEZI|nr:hypothetical protein CCHL11_02516 [Colletotrichum chlorophyti]
MKLAMAFGLLALAAAAPTPEPARERNNLLSSADLHLEHDDVIMYGVNGEYKIIKEAEFNSLTTAGILTYGGDDKVEARDLSETIAEIEARQNCPGLNSEFTTTSTADFLDWDVQISPVVGAQQAPVTLTVSRGYSIANTIQIGGNIGLSYKYISGQIGVDVSRTWTTTDTTLIAYTVPQGNYGVIISQPWTHRIYGDIYTSCTTDNWKKTSFMASSHKSASYGNLNWVTGVFRMCANKKYPIPFCNGKGSHH